MPRILAEKNYNLNFLSLAIESIPDIPEASTETLNMDKSRTWQLEGHLDQGGKGTTLAKQGNSGENVR